MKLEQQIEKLAELGITLNKDVSIEDLLYSFERDAYESRPFDLLLFIFGAEVERPPYQRYSDDVWNFDTKCIVSTGNYVQIVQQLCTLSGDVDYLKDVTDFVNLEKGEAWLKYQVGKQFRKWTIEVNGKWVDRMTLSYLMDDIERDGKRFYYKDNGQAMILFFLDEATAATLNQWSANALELVNPF